MKKGQNTINTERTSLLFTVLFLLASSEYVMADCNTVNSIPFAENFTADSYLTNNYRLHGSVARDSSGGLLLGRAKGDSIRYRFKAPADVMARSYITFTARDTSSGDGSWFVINVYDSTGVKVYCSNLTNLGGAKTGGGTFTILLNSIPWLEGESSFDLEFTNPGAGCLGNATLDEVHVAHNSTPAGKADAAVGKGRDDLLISDFEGYSYDNWVVTGEAFGLAPAKGSLSGQGGELIVRGYEGTGLANSFHAGNKSVGAMTSPDFVIQRRYINFLIGGGNRPNTLVLNLLIGGKPARTATGRNNAQLACAFWDVAELEGKTARIQVADNYAAGDHWSPDPNGDYWGHICVDQIFQSDHKAFVKNVKRTFLISKQYLNLPVVHNGRMSRMKYIVGGNVVREFDIALPAHEPDFYVISDVTAFQGAELTVAIDTLDRRSNAAEQIEHSDTIKNADQLYQEKLRPQLHFTTRRGYNNDANGMMYYKGEYHLFYQHNPYGCHWGNMHWGHAVSTDLVHWQELPVALYQPQYGDLIFSGSGVVDKHDTAGFKAGGEDALVAVYLSTARGVAIAYSCDRGRTFTDYKENPVIQGQNTCRDPKVIWYEPAKQWIMVGFTPNNTEPQWPAVFYTSHDLKHWKLASKANVSLFECPELFELPIDGNTRDTRWVLQQGNGEYYMGHFDGSNFTNHSDKCRFSFGDAFGPSQTFNDMPKADGRRIQIAWGNVRFPEMPFNSMMLFPVELTLRTTDEGTRMFATPVREIETLHEQTWKYQDRALTPKENLLRDIEGELFHIKAKLDVKDSETCGFSIRDVPITYNVRKQELTCVGKSAPLKPVDGKIALELIVDRMTIEIFANGGRVYMPMGINLTDNRKTLRVFAEGGNVKIESLEIATLKCIW